MMMEIDYPILYYFNLILGVSSHLAPDVIHKSSKVFVIFLKVPELGPSYQPCPVSVHFMLKQSLHNHFPEQRGCKWNIMRAGDLYKGSALCKTFYNRSLGCKPIKFVFKALLKPETKLLRAV